MRRVELLHLGDENRDLRGLQCVRLFARVDARRWEILHGLRRIASELVVLRHRRADDLQDRQPAVRGHRRELHEFVLPLIALSRRRHAIADPARSSSTRRRPKTGMSRVRTLPQRSRLFDDESFPSATFASNNDAAYSLQGGNDRIVPATRSRPSCRSWNRLAASRRD